MHIVSRLLQPLFSSFSELRWNISFNLRAVLNDWFINYHAKRSSSIQHQQLVHHGRSWIVWKCTQNRKLSEVISIMQIICFEGKTAHFALLNHHSLFFNQTNILLSFFFIKHWNFKPLQIFTCTYFHAGKSTNVKSS
jgi:hypothetical protein